MVKQSIVKKVVSLILMIIMLLTSMGTVLGVSIYGYDDRFEINIDREFSYEEYLKEYLDIDVALDEIIIDARDYIDVDMDITVTDDLMGTGVKAIETEDSG